MTFTKRPYAILIKHPRSNLKCSCRVLKSLNYSVSLRDESPTPDYLLMKKESRELRTLGIEFRRVYQVHPNSRVISVFSR